MKYYEIRMASDPKIIGVKDGLSQVEIKREGFIDKGQYDNMITFLKAPNYWEKVQYNPDTIFNIEYAIVRKGAIINDFIDFLPHMVGCPFIISDKARSVLERFQMGEHYFFPAKIYRGDIDLGDRYYLLYSPLLDYGIVDFATTLFNNGNVITKKIVRVSNKEDYLRDSMIKVDKGVLTAEFDKTLDLFFPRTGGYFVSERLLQEIVQQGLTGLIIPREKGATFEYPE